MPKRAEHLSLEERMARGVAARERVPRVIYAITAQAMRSRIRPEPNHPTCALGTRSGKVAGSHPDRSGAWPCPMPRMLPFLREEKP